MPCAFGFAIVPTNCCASIFVEGHGERIVSTWKKQKMLGTTFKHMGLSNSKALVVFHLLKKLVRSWMYAILQYLCTSGVLLFRTRLPFTQLERVAHSRQAWKDVETSWSCKIAATATKPNVKFAKTISSWPSVPQSNRFIWRQTAACTYTCTITKPFSCTLTTTCTVTNTYIHRFAQTFTYTFTWAQTETFACTNSIGMHRYLYKNISCTFTFAHTNPNSHTHACSGANAQRFTFTSTCKCNTYTHHFVTCANTCTYIITCIFTFAKIYTYN